MGLFLHESAARHRRPCAAIVAATLAVMQAGCASMLGSPLPTPGPPPEIPQIALHLEPAPLAVEYIGVPSGKGEAAAEGAGRFLAQCAAAPGAGAAGAGTFAAAAYMVWLAGCVLATPVAAGVAGHKAPAQEEVARSIALIGDAAGLHPMHEDFRLALQEAAARIAPGRMHGDSTPAPLVLAISRMSFTGRGDEKQAIAFQLRAQAAVTRAVGEPPLKTCDYAYPSEARPLHEWAAEDARLVDAVLSRALPALAEAITECVFLQYPFPYRGLPSGWTWFSGLQAESPKRYGTLKDPFVATAEGLQPVFRWQAFPRDVDLAADPQGMKRVEDVRYDLMIARQENGTAGPVIYRRSGLPSTAHPLEITLDPKTHYFWTIRARFRLDGREWVTEWAERGGIATRTTPAATQRFTAPSGMSYPFKTP